MKQIINLIFDRIERVLWFRHLLWTLRRNDNYPFVDVYDHKTNSSYSMDLIGEDVVSWLNKHRSDYLASENNGNATGTENSTEVTEEKS